MDVDRADTSRYENGTNGAMNCIKLKSFAEALGVTMDELMRDEKENSKIGTSIQKRYDNLNPVHQNMISETINAYLYKENKVMMIS